MPQKEPWQIEAEGYDAGINPMMGEFKRTFHVRPVPYDHRDRDKFIKDVRLWLSDIKYIYWGEVKANIELYFDEQKQLESSEFGDLDNYAKVICDALKAADGVLIDDSLIQALYIAWIDSPTDPYFELSIRGHPDEFTIKPVSLYEMPDSLFYPFSLKSWTAEGIKEISQSTHAYLLASSYRMIREARALRHSLRQQGLDRLQAWYRSRGLHPVSTRAG